MPRLFVFGIGGTGSRVIRSLTMLLASGVQLSNDKVSPPIEYELIPIIIDPDTQNGDMIRTVELLKLYQSIFNTLGERKDGFFQNKISTLRSLKPNTDDIGIQNTFHLDFSQTLGMPFKEFISYNNITDAETKWFIDLLYTQKNLDDNLTKGFLGNPNVGSVVLNKLKDSEEFKFFGSEFGNTDRIFIVSSIFGGTGAAGFPLLVKHFRDPNNGLTNRAALNNAIIGAITVMPYFKVNPDDNCSVDSGTFITKTKAALTYYDHNLTQVNALYYIGDNFDKAKNYSAHEGGGNQKNEAHFIELASALAIIDFIKTEDGQLRGQSAFYEYSIRSNGTSDIDFLKLCPVSKKVLCTNLSKMFYFSIMNRYYNSENKWEQVWAKRYNFEDSFKASSFYLDIMKFIERHFMIWLEELRSNQRKFNPFYLNATIKNLKNSITSIPSRDPGFLDNFGKFDYGTFDKALNLIKPNLETREQRYMDLWWRATDQVVNKYYNF